MLPIQHDHDYGLLLMNSNDTIDDNIATTLSDAPVFEGSHYDNDEVFFQR